MDIFENIKKLIVKQIRRRDIKPEDITMDTILDSLGFDSLDVAELVIEIENTFSIKKQLEQEELAKVKSVKDIVAIVEDRLKNQ